MPAHDQNEQQQPRRILEKSRTVRRRYQRSNKRFEFTASQIGRIEREEEREKKAKQLREREKRKLANRKKKAEKEAKEREERRRLGIPDPNSLKIPASQPLLANFFGVRRDDKVDGVKEQTEEEREDSGVTQETDTSVGEELNEFGEDGERHHILPVQEETSVMQQQHQSPKANCVSEDFSDLETELGDDWLDDVELEKHMASIENSQKSLSSSAVAPNNVQPQVPAQSTRDTSAGMNSLSESFEDDTSLLLQTLDPTILETFESPKLKAVSHDLKTKTSDAIQRRQHAVESSTSGLIYAAPNVRTGDAQCGNQQVNNSTPTNFRRASPATNLGTSARQPSREIRAQTAKKQQLKITATDSNIKIPSVQNKPSEDTFKKPVAAASMQPRRHLHALPEKSLNQNIKTCLAQKASPQLHVDADDEFGDLPLSTQDVRDLDSMLGLG